MDPVHVGWHSTLLEYLPFPMGFQSAERERERERERESSSNIFFQRRGIIPKWFKVRIMCIWAFEWFCPFFFW